jgi:hypothetical protein
MAVERQVERWVARGECVRGRRKLERLFDDVAGYLDDACIPIHRRAVRLKNVQCLFAWKAHADGFDHVKRGGVDLAHVLVAEDVEAEAGIGIGRDFSGHGFLRET